MGTPELVGGARASPEPPPKCGRWPTTRADGSDGPGASDLAQSCSTPSGLTPLALFASFASFASFAFEKSRLNPPNRPPYPPSTP